MELFLVGSTGRLGSAVASLAAKRGIAVTALDRNAFVASTDLVLLDVSLPLGTKQLCTGLLQAIDNGQSDVKHIKGFVVGTTGHDKDTLELFSRLSRYIPICVVPNFSKGIFLFEQLLLAKTPVGLTVCALAEKLGFRVHLSETHHAQKKDAPSGTALLLSKVANIPPEDITSIRQGQVPGTHTLSCSSDAEALSIEHQAHSRDVFAQGALDLCERIFYQKPKPGFLSKEDFL